MSKPLLLAVVAIVCATHVLTSATLGHAAELAVVHVMLKDHQFQPRLVAARPGQTIVFFNEDADLHALIVVDHDEILRETFVDPGKSLSIVVPSTTRPGNYHLACTIHIDMTGTLRVIQP